MKRIFAVVMAVLMICAMTVVVYATDPADDTVGEPSGGEFELTTDKIISYIQEHLEEISVIITLILTIFYNIKKQNALNKSIGTLNNNAVTVAENSSASISKALTGMDGVSAAVGEYKEAIAALLSEVRANDDEKKAMQTMFANMQAYLTASTQANVEFSNVLAELLVLANIPNSKKDELYARHRAAIDALNAIVPNRVAGEVMADVGQKE